MPINESKIAANLKPIYTKKHKDTLVCANNPFYADMKPLTDAGADKYIMPMQHLDLPTDSATFSDAQTSADTNSLGFARFEIPMRRHYVPVQIDNMTLKGSQKDPQAFWKTLTTHIDGAFRRFGNVMGTHCWGTGFGGIGKLKTTPGAVNYFDLANREDSVKFIPGQLIQSASADSAALNNAGAAWTVTGVNSNTGRITIQEASAIGTVAAAAAGHTLYVKGNRATGAAASPLMGTGFLSYCPQGGTGGTLHGLDTSTSDMLYGRRIAAKSKSIRDAYIELAMEIVRAGGLPKRAYLNPTKYADLLKEMESDKQFTNHDTRAGISFSALVLHVPGVGTVPVICDRNTPVDVGALVTDDWYKISIGEAPDYLDTTNGGKLFLPAKDGVEIRVGGYYNYTTPAPGWQGLLDFSSDV